MQVKKLLSVYVCFALFLSLVITPANQAASRAPVRGKHGMVASVSEIASQVGVEILKLSKRKNLPNLEQLVFESA